MEHPQIPIQGIFTARSLTRVGSNTRGLPHVTSRADRAEIQCSKDSVYVLLTKFSEETLTIPKATILGIAEEVPEQLIDKINSRSHTDPQTPPRPPRQKKSDVLYRKLLQGKLDHLTEDDRLRIEQALQRFAHVFHDEDKRF
jgi:hypothetical protein